MAFSKPIFGIFKHTVDVWRELSHNWIIAIINKLTVVLFLVSVGLLLWRWHYLPSQVPLWYAKPWGEDQLASPYWLFLLPASSLVIYSIDVVASVYLIGEYLVFAQLLLGTSLLVSILTTITLTKILFVIT